MAKDELVDYISPYRHKHPESLRQRYLRDVKQKYYSLNQYVFVAKADNHAGDLEQGEPSSKLLLGCSAWIREGTGAELWWKKSSWSHGNLILKPSQNV